LSLKGRRTPMLGSRGGKEFWVGLRERRRAAISISTDRDRMENQWLLTDSEDQGDLGKYRRRPGRRNKKHSKGRRKKVGSTARGQRHMNSF